MLSDIDDNDSNGQSLSTPILRSTDETRKLFNFFCEDRYDLLKDLIELPNQSKSIDEYGITANQPNDTAEDSFDSCAIHRSRSCPEPYAFQFSHLTHNGGLLNLEELVTQKCVLHKLYSLRLPQFLRLLLDDECYVSYLSWLDKRKGLFKIHEPIQVVNLWRKVKTRTSDESLNYDNFTRAIRYYYKSGAMLKTHTKHTYRFGHV